MKIKSIKFKTTTLASIALSIWIGLHFNLPIEYWIMVFFVYVGLTWDLKK